MEPTADSIEIEHHGDATGGDSGGPFFGFWSDGPYTVGVTSGGERISGTHSAGGTRTTTSNPPEAGWLTSFVGA